MAGLIQKIFGSANDRLIKRVLPLVERINAIEGDLVVLSDADLRGRTVAFRERLDAGETLD
ncbi:MAG: hypothetical protein ACE5FL_09310, partial [Myxococcota bacterium]